MAATANRAAPLLIRAYAGPRMGTGHVMRCLALAQAWQDAGGAVELLGRCDPPAIAARLGGEGIRVTLPTGDAGSADDSAATVARAREIGATWVVVDGYHFASVYQRTLKQAGLRVLWVDDYGHAPPYSADLVLNQNLYPTDAFYAERNASVRLLLGPRYALLRREFLRWRNGLRIVPEQATKVLITMGGADLADASTRFLIALRELRRPGLEVTVVIGPANPRAAQLEELCREQGGAFRSVHGGVDMPELMRHADIAAAAAGSTCAELLFMGLPAMVVVQSDNQQRVAEALGARSLALNLGWVQRAEPDDITSALRKLVDSQTLREQMSAAGRRLVDGLGVSRVLDAMGVRSLILRRVTNADCELLWKWANEPGVRAVSFSTEPIPWENHVQWLETRLADKACLFYIAENSEGEGLGQVRYDVNGEEATISIALAPSVRGAGYGTRLIRQASAQAMVEAGLAAVHAYVKPGNESSAWAFRKAGYQPAELAMVRGQQALHFVLKKVNA